MRILLDAHVSGRRIGDALRAEGHDVLALDEDAELGALPDADVLALAAADRRILVTFNHRHFAPLLRQWAEAGQTHHGCVLVYGLDHSDFALILHGIRRLFDDRPRPEKWVDLADALTRQRASSGS
ncbi:MAG: DUF5615 family PIN-like protein [Gaiellaceae bacterium MAG52_C11]|nr:DUF5615 family PIN-like protein [Candidatus Gaiellasilicea maunaloa]